MTKRTMGACMSEWKDKHPQGRSKTKMTKKEAHKQAIAACLQKTNEGLTFKNFFVSEQTGVDVKEYIRNLPMYQEMLKDPQQKPAAIKLARSFVDEFGSTGANQQVQSYIASEFDALYSEKAGSGGMNIGDWRGEEEYQRRRREEKDIASAANKWEKTTGMDAETGADVKRDNRGRVKHGARTGMDFRPEIKASRIARELQGHGDTRSEIQRRAGNRPAGEYAYQGGESKAQRAAAMVATGLQQGLAPREIKKQLRDELDMTAAGANTYYYKYKKHALSN